MHKFTLKRPETIFLVILLGITVLLRFTQIGYSHLYGDETKTLYWNKTVPAKEHLLNQRKGPVQFLVVWAVEKVTGGFDEGLVRLPFAVAGTISVFVFYFLVKKIYGYKVAIISAYLFSLSGFFIAFSRTAQYQSFLTLFGLSAILFSLHKKWAFAGFSIGLAILTHYDSVFFCVPIIYLFIKSLLDKEISFDRALVQFLLPIVILSLLFYYPYFVQGYAKLNTFGYLTKRVEGSGYAPNNSLYTAKVYNPFLITMIPLFFALYGLTGSIDWKKKLIIFWFLVPFITFEFIIKNPGTHVLNYFIPAIILASVGITNLMWKYSYLILVPIFIVQTLVYVPLLNFGYPYTNFKPDKSYHLFLYGFPYNRGWDQIRQYMLSQPGARNYYTNDNPTLGEYYLKEFDLSPPGSNFLPQYYINVINNQEFRDPAVNLNSNYVLVHEINKGKILQAQIFKRRL